MPEMANAFILLDIFKYLKQNKLITLLRYKICWMRSTANGSGGLAQGHKCVIKVTKIIKFIRREYSPAVRTVTYGSLVLDIKAHKKETERTRLTMGGD
jgi:hypothetical protein